MGKITTCISVDSDTWKKFCSKVVMKHGNNRASSILEELMGQYLKQK
jgi:hypothetical protein